MKTVALLTDFYEADTSYSLAIIAEGHLEMLLNAGYKPIAIVEDIFKPSRIWKEVEIRHIPSGIPRDNDVRFHDGWEDGVAKIRAALDTALDGVEVVITHDLIYQPTALWINMAARDYARTHPDIVWLNWVHSATQSPVWRQRDQRLLPAQIHFPHSKTVFPNDYASPIVARNFRCGLDEIAVVPHPTDVCSYLGFLDITKKLVQERDLLSADAILVYPVRLDRGKQIEHVIHTASAIKKLGRSVRVVVCDFHSTGGDKVEYREDLKTFAIDQGLNSIEATFTSEFDKSLRGSCPRAMVRDLMLLCNVFVMPSKSETYSLIAQEAGLCGAMLILNKDFPPMRSIYGPHADYRKFSSNWDVLQDDMRVDREGKGTKTDTRFHNPDDWFRRLAMSIVYRLENVNVLAQQTRIRKERNPDYIFRRYIEPLFFSMD